MSEEGYSTCAEFTKESTQLGRHSFYLENKSSRAVPAPDGDPGDEHDLFLNPVGEGRAAVLQPLLKAGQCADICLEKRGAHTGPPTAVSGS